MVMWRSVVRDLQQDPHPFGLSLSKPGLVGWFGRCACVECGGRESPGVRVTFFCVAKRKSPKKRRPPVFDPHAMRGGKPASGRLRGAPWNSLCAGARSSDNHGESDHEAWALRRPCSPHNRPAAGAASRGWAAEQPNSHTGLCFARPHLAGASATRCANWAERSDGPFGCPIPRVPFCACLEAQGRGCVRVPQDTRTSCTDSPQLFERSAQRAVSSAAHPLTEHRRLPVAQRRDTHSRVALSLVTFFRRSERKLLARRATPGLRPALKHVARSASKLPPLSTSMLNASKFIATSAFLISARGQKHSKNHHAHRPKHQPVLRRLPHPA